MMATRCINKQTSAMHQFDFSLHMIKISKKIKIIFFVEKNVREVIGINMTKFDTPKINIVLSRFPCIAQDIFKELDNKSLIKCRKLSVPVQNFIDNEKFIWIRQMQKYSGNMEEFYDQWKLVIRKTLPHQKMTNTP